MLIVLGQFDLHPDDVPAAAGLMRTMAAETNQEAGCLLYAFAHDLSTANRIQLSELWQDDASLAAHFQTPHMATFRAGLSQLRVLQRTVKRYAATPSGDL
jgi:quinol monooxygenase YgiN